jgi:hypothetical protein
MNVPETQAHADAVAAIIAREGCLACRRPASPIERILGTVCARCVRRPHRRGATGR